MIAKHEVLLAQAVEKGAQIVCLQELFYGPYFPAEQQTKWYDLTERVPDGPTVTRFAALAKKYGIVLIVPVYEEEIAGLYYNTAAVIDADGSLMGVYRKMHIPDDPLYHEKYYFTPGDGHFDYHGERAGEANGFKVWKTRYATIGVLICWDQWYPEAARITSLLGADILFYPTAIGWHPAEKSEFGQAQVDAWRTIQRSHAIANGVFVASPNRVGHEDEPGTRGLEFFGHSFIADPFGRLLADAPNTNTEILIARCDPRLIEDTRRNWPFLRDRRIDAYAPILSRYLGA
jgi:N-carbamoylputrescine amidase